jgi:hypothetical protein
MTPAYVALAESLGADLWTMDGPLARNAAQSGLPVRLIPLPPLQPPRLWKLFGNLRRHARLRIAIHPKSVHGTVTADPVINHHLKSAAR